MQELTEEERVQFNYAWHRLSPWLDSAAAHPGDLRAAAALGMRAGYAPRPLERGSGQSFAPNARGDFDVTAADFLDLARQLGA